MSSMSSISRLLLLALSSISIIAAQDLPCGTAGYHDQSNVSWFMGNFFYDGSTTLNLCASYCKKNPTCKAFRYSYWRDADAQYCEFFPKSIAPSFKVDATSPYYYFDTGCVLPPFEEPATVTATSLSTLTSSATVISTLLETVTSSTSITVISTLLDTVTSSTSITVMSTQSETVTSSTSITLTSTLLATVTSSTSTTLYYPVTVVRTSIVTRPALPAPIRTVTAFTRTVTSTITTTRSPIILSQNPIKAQAVSSTATQTVTVLLSQTVTIVSTRTVTAPPLILPIVRTVTRTVTAV